MFFGLPRKGLQIHQDPMNLKDYLENLLAAVEAGELTFERPEDVIAVLMYGLQMAS